MLLFNDAVEDAVASYNPVPSTRYSSKMWDVETMYGNMRITVHAFCAKDIVYSVYLKFSDVCEGTRVLEDCNPFSGKWNIHTYSCASSLSMLRERLALVCS